MRPNKKKESKGTRRRQMSHRDVPAKLPQLTDQLNFGFTYRFITTATFTGVVSVSASNLLDAWFVAGTATTAYQLFDFVKIRRVIVRAMGGSANFTNEPAACTVGVEYVGLGAGSYAGGRQKSDSSLGVTNPAMVSLAPDPMSQAAQYQASNGNTLFVVRAVDGYSAAGIVGAVIDVEVSLRNSGDVSPSALGVARAGLTPGNLYYGSLDGQALATTVVRSAFFPRA